MELFSYAYLGIKNRKEFYAMTLSEYNLKSEAYQLQQVKRIEELHLQAFLNQAVQATKGSIKNPTPMFTTFKSFFDTEKVIDDVRSQFERDYKPRSKASQDNAIKQTIAQRIREFNQMKKGGD
ncbi:hypothetical protein [Ligilactobacillus salivarius]|uniref:hypothetical protein n=1 Tax=Ligilactobacillus salivarius TaxID=1624 RepID=UPI001F5BFAAD|nr:hypothetical protein [Ligilactobacillus salivarius]